MFAAVLGGCSVVREVVAPKAPAIPAPQQAEVTPPPPGTLGCEHDPAIDAWEARLRSERRHRAATEHSMARGAQYLPRLRTIVAEAGLPDVLALLPAVESSFRSHARGPTGSRGLWQLEAKTARRFGLVVNRKRDDRLDPERSTRAAVRYLRILYARYNDWPLALAAYNAGEGRIDKALRGRREATFWQLAAEHRLPPINREYVPRFLALIRVVESPVC